MHMAVAVQKTATAENRHYAVTAHIPTDYRTLFRTLTGCTGKRYRMFAAKSGCRPSRE